MCSSESSSALHSCLADRWPQLQNIKKHQLHQLDNLHNRENDGIPKASHCPYILKQIEWHQLFTETLQERKGSSDGASIIRSVFHERRALEEPVTTTQDPGKPHESKIIKHQLQAFLNSPPLRCFSASSRQQSCRVLQDFNTDSILYAHGTCGTHAASSKTCRSIRELSPFMARGIRSIMQRLGNLVGHLKLPKENNT